VGRTIRREGTDERPEAWSRGVPRQIFPKHLKMGVPPVPGVPRPVNTGDFECTPHCGGPCRVCQARARVQRPKSRAQSDNCCPWVRDVTITYGDGQDACPAGRRHGWEVCRGVPAYRRANFSPKHLKMGAPPVPGVPRPVNTGDFEYTPRSGGRAGCAGPGQSPKSKVQSDNWRPWVRDVTIII
jgi:hypothetical protein